MRPHGWQDFIDRLWPCCPLLMDGRRQAGRRLRHLSTCRRSGLASGVEGQHRSAHADARIPRAVALVGCKAFMPRSGLAALASRREETGGALGCAEDAGCGTVSAGRSCFYAPARRRRRPCKVSASMPGIFSMRASCRRGRNADQLLSASFHSGWGLGRSPTTGCLQPDVIPQRFDLAAYTTICASAWRLGGVA